MAAEAEILEELARLRARVPQLTGALVAGTDGLILAQDCRPVDAEGTAALTAAALAVALRLSGAAGHGEFRELVVRAESGYAAVYAAGASAALTVFAEPRTNVGRLHLEARRAGARLGELVDGALERPDRTQVQPRRERNEPSWPRQT
ncbi:roadblock/LC7 domain-containing protein [Streptomyces sp. NPDC050504]|uniref:roadblock/LC7 domain-containing protein n=1 Tax=Streptomyces sp. NPDC050504 TaxID=3365618 RepID=UPI0037ABFAE2